MAGLMDGWSGGICTGRWLGWGLMGFISSVFVCYQVDIWH